MQTDSSEVKIKTNGILKDGFLAVWPICLGYFPIGLAFGVLAEKAGLSLFQIGLMSLLVFAGSSQFIAVSMMSGGIAPVSIILTTFMVNLRHFLMSSSLAVFLGSSKKRLLAIFAYGVTDESFAVNYIRFREGRWDLSRALVVNHTSNFIWIASTVTGGYCGQFIPPGSFGIDYALVAMFICLLVFQLRGFKYVLVALISGGLAVVFAVLIPGNAYIVLASALAATAGVLVKKTNSRQG